MTTEDSNRFPEAERATVPPPPDTGHPQVDQVLRELDGLAQQPVADHHDRLARAHESLHGVLFEDSDPAAGAAGS